MKWEASPRTEQWGGVPEHTHENIPGEAGGNGRWVGSDSVLRDLGWGCV